MDDVELGRRIAYWRRRRGLTQVVFADRIGRSKSWVGKVEGGRRSAGHLAILDLICEVLRVDLPTLIGEEPTRRAPICLDGAEVERIQAALERYPLTCDVEAPLGVLSLRRQIDHAWVAFEFADYDVVSRVLPDLVDVAQRAYAVLQDERSTLLLIETYQIASSTLRKLGEYSLAWLAADRGMALARQSGDSAVIAATGFRIANALLSMGRAAQAFTLAVGVAERIDQPNEADRALYGHVLLQAAMAAATAGDAGKVHDLISEAHAAARSISPRSNYYRLAFCTTNVVLHEVSALLCLGDSGRAIEVARTVEGEQLHMLRKERRASLLVDVARAHSQSGDRELALGHLLKAEAIAPREVRCRPVAQGAIADLVRRSQGAPSPALVQLAERSGVRL